MVADGEGAQVQALLLRGFRGSDTATTGRWGSIRTATGLRAAAESRAAERKKAQEQRRREEQTRKAAARAAAYARRLDELAAEGETPWKQVDEMIATKKIIGAKSGARGRCFLAEDPHVGLLRPRSNDTSGYPSSGFSSSWRD